MTQGSTTDERRGQTPTRVVASLVREARDRRGWTAQQLADRCAEVGMPNLDRSTVANIETGRRRRIGVDELLALAYVLDVAPLHLMLPRADDALVAVLPTVTVTADQARLWVRGREPLPGLNAKTFRVEVPDSEWERRSSRLREAAAAVDTEKSRLALARARLDTISEQRRAADARSFVGGALSSMTGGAEEARLDRLLDTAYDEVALAKVRLDAAVEHLQRVQNEEGADDGER